jgi:lysine 2,3-aminomutase
MSDSEWKAELAGRIFEYDTLPGDFLCTEKEKAFLSSDKCHRSLDFAVTRYFLGCADPVDPADPIRREFMPTTDEFVEKVYETGDPLCEKDYEPIPLLIHRYPDRALFRVTSLCAVYCRFCYRRNMLTEKKYTAADSDIRRIADYISSHRELGELLLSGGDPLVLEDETLDTMIGRLRKARKDIMLRVCSRVPVVLPSRITSSLVALIRRHAPVRIVTQFNHPNEITEPSRKAVASLTNAGVEVYNQTVLLRGINNDSNTLLRLFDELCRMQVTPSYLFQGDLARGTSHFRVPLAEGLRIYDELTSKASGIKLPLYALDLPGGGGKIPLRAPFLRGKKDGWYHFHDHDGKAFAYPAE